MKKAKVMVVYPPAGFTEYPYLSTATLVAYLKKQGVEVDQKDLNVAFWKQFYEKERLEEIYKNILGEYQKMLASKNRSGGSISLRFLLKPIAEKSFEDFEKAVNSGKISRNLFRFFCKRFSNYANKNEGNSDESTLYYHDLAFEDISESRFTLSSKDLVKQAKGKSKFNKFFEKMIEKEEFKLDFDLLGISTITANQVVPAFALAYEVKKRKPDVHVTMGGPWCTQLYDVIPEQEILFDIVDSVIFFEGEEALTKIAERLGENDLQNVPNIAFKKNGKVVKTMVSCGVSLDDLTVPCFDGLPFEEYDLEKTFPLQTSRGCVWGKCIYCSYYMLEPHYKLRKISHVVDDIKLLVKKHNAKKIVFVDSSMTPARLKELAVGLIESDIKVEYACFARLEKQIVPILGLLYKSGCRVIQWGLESGSQRVVDILGKGVSVKEAKMVLRESKKAGIHNRVLLMYGSPGESFDDVKKSIDFIKENNQSIGSFVATRFVPEKHTEIENKKEELGIVLGENQKYDLELGYTYKSKNISKAEIAEADDKFRELHKYFAVCKSTSSL